MEENVKISKVNYLSVIFPEYFSIGSIKLMPLTIGHLILLAKYNNYFSLSSHNDECQVSDLVGFLMICSTKRFSTFVRWYGKPFFYKRFFKRIIKKLNNVGDKQNVVEIISNYLNSHLNNRPDYKSTSKEGGKEAGSPYLLTIIVLLMSKMHLSYNECLDIPIDFALWSIAVLAEQEGSILV
jgi:hypothetical protein